MHLFLLDMLTWVHSNSNFVFGTSCHAFVKLFKNVNHIERFYPNQHSKSGQRQFIPILSGTEREHRGEKILYSIVFTNNSFEVDKYQW